MGRIGMSEPRGVRLRTRERLRVSEPARDRVGHRVERIRMHRRAPRLEVRGVAHLLPRRGPEHDERRVLDECFRARESARLAHEQVSGLEQLIDVLREAHGAQPTAETLGERLDLLGGLVHSQRVLLALTQKGVSREDAYTLVQRNAMPVWRGEGNFLDLLKKDKDVSALLTAAELESLFDLGYHTKHVDTIFRRVFGAA